MAMRYGSIYQEKNLRFSLNSGEGIHWVRNLDDELPIFVGSSRMASEQPMTLYQYLQDIQYLYGYKNALAERVAGKWKFLTYVQYLEEALKFARALVSLGVTSKSCINIIGHNTPKWILSFVGSTFANCIPIGIDINSSTQELQYYLEHTEAKIVVV